MLTVAPAVCISVAIVIIIGIRVFIGRSTTRLCFGLRSAPPVPPQCRRSALTGHLLDLMTPFKYKSNSSSPSCSERASISSPVGMDIANVSDQVSKCSICLEDFTPGVVVRRLSCGHLFHRQCVDLWLLEHSDTCPLW